jgi:Rrf2 family protein
MNANQQFAVSCHILAMLAAYPDAAVTSETIAGSVDTNPVVIRRIMSHLRQHGLVDSRPGASGGWRLIRPPSDLNLREVYRAVSHETVLAMHQHPNPDCPIGGNIKYSLGGVFEEAQQALEMALEKVSIATVLENTLRENHHSQISERENYD